MNSEELVSFLKEELSLYQKEAFKDLSENESLTLSFYTELSHFLRLNNSQVRQSTGVTNYFVNIFFYSGLKYYHSTTTLCFNSESNLIKLKEEILKTQKMALSLPDLPSNPHPQGTGSSFVVKLGQIPQPEDLYLIIKNHTNELDFTGLITQGLVVNSLLTSSGQKHLFATENFIVDYSIFKNTHAVKGNYSGYDWSNRDFIENINDSTFHLNQLQKDKIHLKKGDYNVYLAPPAFSEILKMLSWQSLSENAYQKGYSSFKNLRDKKMDLSKKFTLRENFEFKLCPQFNNQGEMANNIVPIFEDGKLIQFLTSTKTAKEYNVKSNFANAFEAFRCLEVLPGKISKEHILKTLGTGIYISEIHYVNWSDFSEARLTGMTRYACFWVESGEIKDPIHDLRFDVSLYDLLGDNLIDLTDFQELKMTKHTYATRKQGGSVVPGIFCKAFPFTL